MPIMKYTCRSCGKEFAKIFFSPENAPKRCPVCGGDNVQEKGPAFDAGARPLSSLICTSCEGCDHDHAC
jgi:putative FmdB family regulatory protein